MIDKLTLNNQIVSMRGIVRQAKVHVIRKLVRESRKLRLRNAPQDIKEKYDRKADRRVEEIMIVKKINLDDVSKFALKNTDDPLKKIMHADTTLEERALYRLVAHKNLAEKVKQFRDKYPDCLYYMGETLEELGARRRKSTKEPRKLEHRAGNRTEKPSFKNRQNDERNEVSIDRGSSPTNKNGSTPITKEDETEGNILVSKQVKSSSKVSQWDVEDLEDGKDVEEVKERNGTKKHHGKEKPQIKKEEDGESRVPLNNSGSAEVRKFSELGPTATDEVVDPCLEASDDHKASDETKEMNKCILFPGKEKFRNKKTITLHGDSESLVPAKNSGLAEVKKFSQLINDGDEVPAMKKERKEDDEGPSTTGEAVDPFFVTADGKSNYLTSVVVKEVDEEVNEETSWMRGKSYEKKWDSGARDSRFERGRPGRGGRGMDHCGRGMDRRGRGMDRRGRGMDRRGRGMDQCGRGSQFSQERRGGERGSRFGAGADFRDSKNSYKTDSNAGSKDAEHLHPSWEAKRKLKEQSISNVVFRGKKIKFDDDD